MLSLHALFHDTSCMKRLDKYINHADDYSCLTSSAVDLVASIALIIIGSLVMCGKMNLSLPAGRLLLGSGIAILSADLLFCVYSLIAGAKKLGDSEAI